MNCSVFSLLSSSTNLRVQQICHTLPINRGLHLTWRRWGQFLIRARSLTFRNKLVRLDTFLQQYILCDGINVPNIYLQVGYIQIYLLVLRKLTRHLNKYYIPWPLVGTRSCCLVHLTKSWISCRQVWLK